MKLKTVVGFLLILLPLGAQSPKQDGYTVQGTVKDSRGQVIRHARIEVTILADRAGGSATDEPVYSLQDFRPRVAYSGYIGRWKVVLPQPGACLVKVSASGYEPERKLLSLTGEATGENKLSFVLRERIDEIARGSIEHAQLYVTLSHQERIDTLAIQGNGEKLIAFIQRNGGSSERLYYYRFAGHATYAQGRHDLSRRLFETAGSRIWNNLRGHDLLQKNQLQPALEMLSQGETTGQRAADLLELGELLMDAGRPQDAIACLRLAFADYRRLSRSFLYRWDEAYIEQINSCRRKLLKLGDKTRDISRRPDAVSAILRRAGRYCQRLDRAAIYYYCHEVKRDHVVLVRELARSLENPADFFQKYVPISLRGTRIVDFYKYDLQFIKEKGRGVHENRKLLEETLDDSNPGIPVRSYTIRKALRGPHTLIGFGWQEWFDYRIAGRQVLYGQPTVILEALPRGEGVLNKLSGKIWVKPETGAVLKIEWNNRRGMDPEQIRARGLMLDREPVRTFVSEFGLERNGLWFPTRCLIMETYLKPGEKAFERVRVDIAYTNYQFFMVGSSVKYDG